MEAEQNEKTFDHKKASVADKIALLGELEHIRAHAVRSAVSLYDEESDDSDWIRYAVIAKQARDIRRLYQKKHLPELSEYDWCLFKAASRLRQLAYEVQEDDYGMLKIIDDFVDDILGGALNMDLSDCVSCKEDKSA